MLYVVLTVFMLNHGHLSVTRHDTKQVFVGWRVEACFKAAALTARRAQYLAKRGSIEVKASCEDRDYYPT